ncbi:MULTISPECIES: hypothetical protein [Streptomyces]|uniref:hypothetical protein n=1 Tax=Streptomyces TaxID=1883 RepID=UPI0038108048
MRSRRTLLAAAVVLAAGVGATLWGLMTGPLRRRAAALNLSSVPALGAAVVVAVGVTTGPGRAWSSRWSSGRCWSAATWSPPGRSWAGGRRAAVTEAVIVLALLLVALSATAVVAVRDPVRQSLVPAVLGVVLAVLFTVPQAPHGVAPGRHRPAGRAGPPRCAVRVSRAAPTADPA